jgi:hypothetical protein
MKVNKMSMAWTSACRFSDYQFAEFCARLRQELKGYNVQNLIAAYCFISLPQELS